MPQPPDRWFDPPKFDNPLSEIVNRGDLTAARQYLDEAFWENRRETPGWPQLKIALLRRDLPMVKLLATWGARPSDEQMAQFRTAAAEQYGDYLKLLRQAGLRGVDTRWEELPAKPLSGEEAASLPAPEDDIEKLPMEWRRVLKSLQQTGAPEAVIAGGALRDTFNGAAVKDVDIFLRARGNRKAHRSLLKEAFAAANVTVIEQSFSDSYGTTRIAFPDPVSAKESTNFGYGLLRKRATESWKILAGPNRTEYNVIFVDDNIDRKMAEAAPAREQQKIFAGNLLGTFDIGLCQIATDGDVVVSTPEYKSDVKKKEITLLLPNGSSEDHLRRVVKKYPDWRLSPAAKDMLKPKIPKPLPPRSRYSYY